jgi:hypothetical protein
VTVNRDLLQRLVRQMRDIEREVQAVDRMLVSQALNHSNQSVRRVGARILKEMSEDPWLADKILPSRLHVLMRRMRETGTCPPDETCPQTEGVRDSEAGENESEEGGHDSEEGENPRLRIPKRAANPRRTALFGIRSKTVQYVQYVLKILRVF